MDIHFDHIFIILTNYSNLGFALSKLFPISIFGLCLLLLGVLVPLNANNNIPVLGQLETSQKHQLHDPTLKDHTGNDSTFDTSTVPSSPIAVQGSYTDVTSGLKVTFPSGWNGYETIDSDNVKTVSVSIPPPIVNSIIIIFKKICR